MGIFTDSINKNLSLKKDTTPFTVKSQPLKNTSSTAKILGEYSLKKVNFSNPSVSSYTQKRLKLKSPTTHKFVLTKTAKSSDIPFKTSSAKSSKSHITSPSEHISADEIHYISKEIERDARRYLRRF